MINYRVHDATNTISGSPPSPLGGIDGDSLGGDSTWQTRTCMLRAAHDSIQGMNEATDHPAVFEEDVLLMMRVKGGEEEALRQLIKRWQNPLINFFYRSLSSRADAEDLAQAVFIKLHGAAGRYEPTARFSTYLFHIARRVLLNEYRRRGRKPLQLFAPEDLPNPAAPDPERKLFELEEVFQRGLAEMPENHRTAILLLKQQELSYAEIAGIMETTESLIKTWIFRARQLLKEELKKTL